MEKNNQVKIATFLTIFFSGILLFLSIPKNVLAVDNPEEGYGWGRIVTTTGGSNQIIYNVFDSVTRAAISADSISITLVEAYASSPQANITWSCTAPCPVSHTFTVTNNTSGGMWVVYSIVQKSGYHTTIDPSNYYNGPLTYTGTQVRNYNIYLTDNSKSFQFKKIFPVMGTWYNFPPTHTSMANPAFTNALGPWIAWWVRVHQSNLSVISGPALAPFPATFNFVPLAGIMDGVTQFWGAGTKDDSDALSGNAPPTWYGMDRAAPTSSCSITSSGPYATPATVNFSFTSVDTSFDVSVPSNQANIKDGELQYRVNGGAWATRSTITNAQYSFSGATGGTATATLSLTESSPGLYDYRYRARDNAWNNLATPTQTQWSGFASCGAALNIVNQNFTISVSPASSTVEQGQGADYSITLTSVNGFSGNVTLSTNPIYTGISPDYITTSFTGSNVVSLSSGGTVSATLHVQTSLSPSATPPSPPSYPITVSGVSGGLNNSATTVTLLVTKFIPKPWIQTTNGDFGSKGTLLNSSIKINNTSPASNASYLVVSDFARTNFTSAKSWLIDSYAGGISIGVPTGSGYYDYFWEKFGKGRATPINISAETSVCVPPTAYTGFTSYGFNNTTASNCVLGNATSLQTGGRLDNGVFLIDGDLTYNIDLLYNGTNSNSVPRAGSSISLTGNPTVIFVTGKLYINKNLKVSGNKKIIFIVRGDNTRDISNPEAVQINARIAQIDAFIVTNGSVNTFKWLNARNAERYRRMQMIEQKIIEYRVRSGAYPLAGPTDTSNGCSTSTASWWFDALNPTGGNWTGTGINSPCSATQGLRYLLGAGLGAGWPAAIAGYTGIDIDAIGCVTIPPAACIDPTNGTASGIPGKNTVLGNDGTIKRPKRFAIRYASVGTTAYDIFASMEDDASYDRGSDQPDPEFHMCGGDYNNPSSWIRSETNQYCYKNNLIVNGGIVAQGGFSLVRTSRDDNDSGYGCPNHCPTPAEAFNFDPSILYYFAKVTGGNPLLAETQSIIREERP